MTLQRSAATAHGWAAVCDGAWWHAVAALNDEHPLGITSACGLSFDAVYLSGTMPSGDEACPSCGVLACQRAAAADDPPMGTTETVGAFLAHICGRANINEAGDGPE